TGTGGGAVFSPDRRFNAYQAGFDASWEIDVFGGQRRAVEAAEADLESTIENQRFVLVSLLGEIGRDYVEVRRLQRQLDITRNNAKLQRDTADLTRKRVTAGLNSELDAKRSEAQASFTEAQIPALDRDLAFAVHRLGVLVGQGPGALRQQLAESRPIPQAKAALHVGIPSELLRRRPDIRRAERDLAAATARIGAATADLYPKFELVGTVGLASLQSKNFFNGDSLFASISPQLSWPVFAGGRIKANIEAVSAREEQAFIRYEQTVLGSLEEVENAIVAYAREQTRRTSLADAASAQRRAVELVRDRFRQGLVDFLDVLDAERALNVAENDLVQSHALVTESLIALYKALGGGWDVDAIEAETRPASRPVEP
ncbi:MAG TPA: efflux transporter outer membrane subunit, partial [Planctomycetota bacterium]|nr:efflux transporter outer membrane subunit [Planctomycetota bacterium]